MRRLFGISSFLLTIVMLSYSSFAQKEFEPGKLHPDAPEETKQFGQLVGIWIAEQTSRNRDGTWSEKKSQAEWRWYYILDGHAIQDDWFEIDSTETLRWFGTNIRIYNPEEKLWHMAWIDKTNRRLGTFTAVYEDDRIIMEGTNAKGRRIRNIFSDITAESFNWTQQWTFDEGNSWVDVSKIHCTRK